MFKLKISKDVHSLVVILASVIVGSVVGIFSFALHLLIEVCRKFFLEVLGNFRLPVSSGEIEVLKEFPSIGICLPLFLIPAIGGLLCGLIALIAPETYGGGTDEVVNAFHMLRGFIRARVPFIKTIVSALTIGSGGSGGREGPIVHIGGGVGSVIADIFKMNDRCRRILVASGIAGGMGSIFLAPIGGAIFGIEVLYKRDYEVEALIPAVISSIMAYVVFQSILSAVAGVPFGSLRIFKTENVRICSAYDLLGYAILGVLAGLVSLLYIYSKVFFKKVFDAIPTAKYVKPAIGGFIVGLIGMYFPYILGTGYGYTQLALLGKLSITVMALATILKVFATTITVSSGGSGGLFAPAVVIGCMLGGTVGGFLHSIFPDICNYPEGFMLAGMAALVSGTFKTPLSAIIMVVEMTGNYNLLPALAISSVTSYLITRDISIVEAQVATRAESPAHRAEMQIDVLRNVRVRDAMIPAEKVVTVSPSNTVFEVLNLIEKTGHIGYPVLNNGELVGIITFEDVEKVPIEKRKTTTVSDVMTRNLVVTYPDETLEDALIKLVTRGVGRLPVVEREDKKKLVGLITRSDIMKAHAREISRLYG